MPNFATTPEQLPFGKTGVAGPGWASFMIHTDGSIVGIKLWATSPQSPNVLGSFFYDEQEEFLGGFDFSVHRAQTGAAADINVIPGTPIHEDITIQAEPEGGFGYTATYDPHGTPSTFKVLVFGAGDQVSWSYDGGDNPADVRLLGIETGTSAFLYMSDEFLAAANGGVNVLGTGGRVTLMADLTMDVTDTLIANWLPISSPTQIPPFGESINRLTITTPTGEEECLYAGLFGCSWPRFHGDTAQGPGRYVFHMTGDGFGIAQNGDDVMLYGADARLPIDQTQIEPPILTSAVSRKTHGSAGIFDIDLPLTGNPGIECRDFEDANSGRHQIVFTFVNPVTVNGTQNPKATLSAPKGGSVDTVEVNNSVVTVNLKDVGNEQMITLTLLNVSDGTNSGDVSIPIGILFGDVNGDGFVLSGDYTSVRQKSGTPVDENTAKYDVNVDGFILSGDYTAVRQQSGTHF